MIRRFALRLLPLLAVISLALTPMAAPAAMADMHASMEAPAGSHHVFAHSAMGSMDMAGMAMDEMPCCPQDAPDCAKGCPLMALCVAGLASLLPTTIAVPTPVTIRNGLIRPGDAAFASVHGAPLPEPPRA